MFERFTKDARAVVTRAVEVEAAALGAHRVEAEHLLLALAAGPVEGARAGGAGRRTGGAGAADGPRAAGAEPHVTDAARGGAGGAGAADGPRPTDLARATTRLLADAGLDHDGVLAALERESARSLAAVGVAAGDFALPNVARAPHRNPRFGSSSKLALERALRVAVARGDRRIVAPHLLLGILRAQAGTVPRALSVAEVDAAALATAAEHALDAAR